jgi:peptide-methionine (S)-S-oxide reductase
VITAGDCAASRLLFFVTIVLSKIIFCDPFSRINLLIDRHIMRLGCKLTTTIMRVMIICMTTTMTTKTTIRTTMAYIPSFRNKGRSSTVRPTPLPPPPAPRSSSTSLSGLGTRKRYHTFKSRPLQVINNENNNDVNNTSSQSTKKKKKGNFFTELARAFSASSPVGSGGGSFNLLIDYNELPFPGPEIGTWALEHSTAKTNTTTTTTTTTSSASSFDDTNDDYPSLMPSRSPSLPHLELMTVAGGCFWGIQLLFDRIHGVEYTLVGYTQGLPTETRPNYDQVSAAGATRHTEAVLVYFDPTIVSYATLIKDVFLKHIDPTTVNGQGRDYGRQYRTGIYPHTASQEETARRILMEDIAPNTLSKKPIATELKPATIFWPAESYHQKYLQRGGRYGVPQDATKGSTETIRCYG